MKHTLLTTILVSILSLFAFGQNESNANDTTPFYRLSLEELMNINVTVASQLPMTNRESPGIITIITGEEIFKSGAKDLMQVLQQVPGFDFSVDVEGIVGIGVRGNWAHEGKVLMLWDGMELNEDLYSTLQFGNHYPLDRIKRIEIIRGPGSAMYGGNAEYAVINIITDNNSEFNGVHASVSDSRTKESFGTRTFSLAGGRTFGEAHINLSTSFIQGDRSKQMYTDNHGNSYDMKSGSGITNTNYRMDLFIKGFSLTALYDGYSVEQRDGYDMIYLRSYDTEFNTGQISAKYELRSGKRFSITPGIRYKFQQPWSYRKAVTDDEFEPFNTTVDKKDYYINTTYDPSDRINFTGGLEYFNQQANQNFDTLFFNNGRSKFFIDNYAIYLQSIVRLRLFNVILGSRFDYNPFYGSSFVPRIGITRVWPNFHIKTLYSRAFRAPSIENINASPEILPERTAIAEIETGFKLSQRSYLTANVYDISTWNPIIFYYDQNGEDKYKNETSTGTRGFELEYKWKSSRWYAAVNYSHYTTAGHPVVSIYQIPGHDGQLLAFPSHKINLNGNVHLSDHFNFNPSLNYISKRYSYFESNTGDATAVEYNPSLYLNLCLNIENVFCKGFIIQATCLDVFDQNTLYIQPYYGNHAPLPGTGREFLLRLTYSFSSKGNK